MHPSSVSQTIVPGSSAARVRGPSATRIESWLGLPGLLWGSVLIVSLAPLTAPVTDPDFWWHVRTGRWIVEHAALPHHDLYTFTAVGHPWTDYEYLSEVLIWLLFAHGGLAGVSIGFGLLTWIGLLFLARTVQLDGSPFTSGAPALALGVVAAMPVWGPRVQVIAFTFACVELWLLRRFMARPDRSIFWLPPLVALWANLHGSWPLALALLALAMMTAGWRLRLGPEPEVARARLRILVPVTALAVLATLCTPHGPAVYGAALAPLTSRAQQALIQEWQSPDFHDPALWALGAMILLLVAGLAHSSRADLFGVLVSLTTLALALLAVRNIPLFVAGAVPTLAAAWGDILRRACPRRRLPAGPRLGPRLGGAITAVVLAAVLVATGAATGRSLGRQDQLVRRNMPVGAANWLAAHPSLGTRMFNDWAWGGYLVYRFAPEPHRRVFIFGEASVMGDPLIWSYAAVAFLHPDWQQILDASGVDYAVLHRNDPLAMALVRRGWKVAYQDQTAVIVVRASLSEPR